MSEPNPAAAAADQQRRYREFLDLLPLAINLAGLPTSEGTRNFSEDQIELVCDVIAVMLTAHRALHIRCLIECILE